MSPCIIYVCVYVYTGPICSHISLWNMLGFVPYLCCYEFHRMMLDILCFMGPCHDEQFYLIRLTSRNHYLFVLEKKMVLFP